MGGSISLVLVFLETLVLPSGRRFFVLFVYRSFLTPTPSQILLKSLIEKELDGQDMKLG
jgi:hypothetical protein